MEAQKAQPGTPEFAIKVQNAREDIRKDRERQAQACCDKVLWLDSAIHALEDGNVAKVHRVLNRTEEPFQPTQCDHNDLQKAIEHQMSLIQTFAKQLGKELSGEKLPAIA